jgi:hypothetical protein
MKTKFNKTVHRAVSRFVLSLTGLSGAGIAAVAQFPAPVGNLFLAAGQFYDNTRHNHTG